MPAYNYNPSPRAGQGAFGSVPGVITPPNPAGDLAGQFPNLRQTNAALSRNINAGLEGQLSPATINALQDANAAFGIMSGMPGLTPGGFTTNRLGRNIGLTAEALSQRAIENYNTTIPNISRSQTVDPALLYQIALQNSIMSAAPDPSAAARYSESLYNRYLGQMGGGGGGGGGGFGGGPGGGTRRPTGEAGMYVGNALGPFDSPGEDFSQRDWWDSIGYNPGGTTTGDWTDEEMDWLQYGGPETWIDTGGGADAGAYTFGNYGGGSEDWGFGENDTGGYDWGDLGSVGVGEDFGYIFGE